ncbi:MAG TPA: hypothetical protein VK446_12240 [Methylocystis sp.]|nr:hypothetical protein [Methylocystis sp.]
MSANEISLPPFGVAVEPSRAASFARETGFLTAPEDPPLCYPAVWLTSPEILNAVERICAEARCAPVHEKQRFVYDSPLRFGAQYRLSVVLRREAEPERLAITARVETEEGACVARVETLLRLVSRAVLEEAGA